MHRLPSSSAALVLAASLTGPVCAQAPAPDRPVETLVDRISPPPGFDRPPVGRFGAWLRDLPLLPGRPALLLHDGTPKRNQQAHAAVFDVSVGPRDLQQCADAVMRLRAEFLRATGCADEVAFDFTSGDRAGWKEWRAGMRPRVAGNDVRWERRAAPPIGAAEEQDVWSAYLDAVFTYAGSASLARELLKPPAGAPVEPGDVFIRGGHPGHAVLVVDVAETAAGERRFLLAQSYMPAQQIHLLRRPGAPADRADVDPWYPARDAGTLATPEWTFDYRDRRRFAPARCDSPPGSE